MKRSRGRPHRGTATASGHVQAPAGPGLPLLADVRPEKSPGHLERNVLTPLRTIGIGTTASLKASFWYASVDASPQAGDSGFVSLSYRTSAGEAWRDSARSGRLTTLPFEGAQWRFDHPMTFTQLHVPFPLVDIVCEALFERPLAHDDIRMPANIEDPVMHALLQRLHERLAVIEPSHLLLDSWAMIVADTLLRRLSSHGERQPRGPFGRIPGQGIARVVDLVEAQIDQDLRLASLADAASMSLYHFARSFRATTGMSPHAYVLSRRVARARVMLDGNAASLAEVALACGFSSQAHLTTAFRRGLGLTPGAYRASRALRR